MASSMTKAERREAYADKIEEKRERFAARAEKAREASSAAHGEARRIGSFIPLGQPILVGHHSEKRHRRDIDKIDRSMRKAIDLDSKASHYERKAESYGASGAIMSDNPDAIDLLREKLAAMQAERENYKAANKLLAAVYRKAKKALGHEPHTVGQWETLIGSLAVSDELRRQMLAGVRMAPSYQFVKFGYQITNLGGNIRRVEKRIAAMEREEKPAAVIEGEGFTLEECADDCRIRFFFDGKPAAEVRQTLKRHGFRWSPRAGAWQRLLNSNGRYAAQQVAGLLAKAEG